MRSIFIEQNPRQFGWANENDSLICDCDSGGKVRDLIPEKISERN